MGCGGARPVGAAMQRKLATETRDHSGIGLALSKRLVEAHGGWIKLDSKTGERGTAFHVWWPRFQFRKDASVSS